MTGPPDTGTIWQYSLTSQWHPYEGSNYWESVSWDKHTRETESSEYVPHTYDHWCWASVVQVPLLKPVKEGLGSILFLQQKNKYLEDLIQCLFTTDGKLQSSRMLKTQKLQDAEWTRSTSPRMSVFTSHHSTTSHKTSILLSIIKSLDSVFTATVVCHTESNKKIAIFWTYNAQVRFHEKRSDFRTDIWRWKIRKTVYKMISSNTGNHPEEMVQYVSCHAKQSAMEWTDL